ncbi:hypothetical protein BGZ76_008342, partial [Entomortierella beljakovae]
MYSRFLSEKKRGQGSGDEKHPVWTEICKNIRDSSDTSNLLESPGGLSFTINEHIRQFSTAVSNLWEGSIYTKTLDYLTRILLRLHLAPQRERGLMEKIEVAKAKGKEKKQK